MKHRVRHVNMHADEFLAAVAGEMSPAELGVYWMICLLIYSRGGTVRYDLDWLRAKFRPGKGNQAIGAIVERLIEGGRVFRDGPEIGVRRALDEVETALRRIRDASERPPRRGRQSSKNKEIESTYPIDCQNLTTNHKPLTTKEPNADALGGRADAPDLRPDSAAFKVKRNGTKRKTTIDPDWTPSGQDREYAIRRGHNNAWVEDQAERFRLRCLRDKPAYDNWHAAWCTWVRNAEDFAAKDNRAAGHTNGAATQSGQITAAMRAVLSRREMD